MQEQKREEEKKGRRGEGDGVFNPLPSALSRREWLRRGALAGVGLGAALLGGTGCDDLRKQTRNLTGPLAPNYAALPKDAGALQVATHVANRAAFGPRPGDIAHIAEMGPKAWIEEQLADRDSIGEDPAVNWRINALDTQTYQRDSPDIMWAIEYEQLLAETQQAALLRATYSLHQLREVMADFWTNHFNIYALKNEGQVLVPSDTEHVLRPHLLGSFPEMLSASAASPAMLNYLDNKLNKRGVANENYARELLELHTLGVKSGYTQKDIQEVARCFTGWTLTSGRERGWEKGAFTYDKNLHDEGAKFIPFLNLHIRPNGGQKDADVVLEHLGTHLVTGRFLARKLCRRFLGSAPEAVVEQAATAFVKSKGSIPALLRPILLDALFDPAQNQPILKRPLDMAVSALRVLAADTDGGAGLEKHLSDMGQPLYEWPMPDGFPEKTAAWTGSLLPRWNFAVALTSNAISGTQVDLKAPLAAAKAQDDPANLDALIETILSRPADALEVSPLRTNLRDHIAKARQASIEDNVILAEMAGLLLAAPQFQWK